MAVLSCRIGDGVEFDVPPGPAIAAGFREKGRHRLALAGGGPWRLVVDDVLLPCASADGLHEWEWEPGFHAGVVCAELHDAAGACVASYRLQVAPDAGKLADGAYRAMLDELLAADPLLVFDAEAAQHRIGADGDFSSVHLSYARLKLYGRRYLDALAQVAARPLAVLREERRRVRAHRVHRIDRQTLRGIAMDPAAFASLASAEGADGRARFDVPASRDSLDTAAHRMLLAHLMAVVQRIRDVRARLEALAARDRPGQARTAMAPRLPLRRRLLDELEQGLERLRRSPPLSAARRPEVSAAALTTIAGHPAYARAFRLGWQALRTGIAGEDAEELLALCPSWELYERWCFLAVARVVQARYPELAWSRHRGGAADRAWLLGKAPGTEVQLHLQATFGAVDRASAGRAFHSISGERRPDIVLAWKTGAGTGMAIFDAKYRVGRDQVLDAMQSAHVYRDALRWEGERARHVALLVPAGGGVPALEDPAFHDEHGVGVLPLSPATGTAAVAALLARIMP